MNNHLLPFPYNLSQPPTLLERAVQPLSDVLFGSPKQSVPQKPPRTPISLQSNEHGDLTVHGTFDEVQAQLKWLSCQPHTHKIVIAGNHDILLDEASDGKFLKRGGDRVAERKELDWADVRYLQDEAVTLELPVPGLERQQQQARRVKIYGSPRTPEFGLWAFQYPAIRDVWTGRVPDDTDILVVHGPPALYGDCDGGQGPSGRAKVKGDGYLLREIQRVRPKMVICGHIHGAFGFTSIQHNELQEATDGLQMRWAGYSLVRILQESLRSKLATRRNVDRQAETLVVNAALAPSYLESENKSAITIDFY